MTKSQFIKLIVALVLPLSIGAFAGMFTSEAIPGWYATLNRPSFNPPNWLFGPVWTTLYLLMGISFYMIWKQEKSKERDLALLFFFIQLALNFAWSFIFFYFNKIGFAFAEIVLLWLSIVLMMIRFYKIKPITAYINIPYLLWGSFASMLNLSYYLLN
jgi:tryptophan-rich sensory protein